MLENDRKISARSYEPASLERFEHRLNRPTTHRLPSGNTWSIKSISTYPSRVILAGLCIMAFLLPSASRAAQRNEGSGTSRSLAVLAIENVSERDKDMAALLTDAIRNELAKSSAYSVMDRSSMIAKLKDQSLSLNNCSTKVCAIEAGQLLGVQTVIVGSLSKIGKITYLSLSRVNVTSRTIEFSVEDKCPGEKEDLLLAGAETARKLMGELSVKLPVSTVPENKRFSFRELTGFDKELATIWARDAFIAGKTMTWEEATEFIQRLNKKGYAGYDDWRLPDKNELASLIAYAKSQGKKNNIHDLLKNAGFKNIKADYYWSATPPEDDSGLAWVLDMYSGDISTAAKSNKCCLWPVRTGSRSFEEHFGQP